MADEVHTEIRYMPPVSDEVHTETQTQNEFIFSDEVFRFRFPPIPQVQMK